MHNLRLAIEFPPGASILIPSAIVPHANVVVQPGETRQSVTQYCAGGLLRWADCGFQTFADFAKADPVASRAFHAGLGGRVSEQVKQFSLLSELESDRAALARGEL